MKFTKRTLCAAAILPILFLNVALSQAPVYVTSIADNNTSLRLMNPQGIMQELYSQSHALLIGNITYTNKSWKNLDPIKAEIELLRDVLEKQNFKVAVHYNLKHENLIGVIDDFVSTHATIPGSRIFVYYSGHGYSRDIGGAYSGYLVPMDAPPSNDINFRKYLVPMTMFESWAKTPDAKHMLFVFDSCFSGSFFGNLGKGDPPGRPDPKEPRPANYVFSDLAMSRSRQFIAAGTATQSVPANSIFTKLLAQALRGQRPSADVNWDGFLTGLELANYLSGDVPSYYAPDDDPETPQYGKLRDPLFDVGDFVFKLQERAVVTSSNDTAASDMNKIIAAKPINDILKDAAKTIPAAPATAPTLRLPSDAADSPTSSKIDDKLREKLSQIIEKLTSEDSEIRRGARADLSKLLSSADKSASAELAAQLVRALPNGSYRYQLGVSQALSNTNISVGPSSGWISSEPSVSKAQLARALAGTAAKDPTLLTNLKAALSKLIGT